MKYLCIDDGAVTELISGREMQSVDFEDGARLVKNLKNGEAFKGVGRCIVTVNTKGMMILTPGTMKLKRFLVVDCETSGLFTSLPDEETLSALQKTLRFCAKIWSGSNAFTASERMISGTTKTILFPLPFSKSHGFRVAIERNPSPERLQKRDMVGRFLLLYKSGSDGANSETEIASTTNFSKAFEDLPAAISGVENKQETLKKHNNGQSQQVFSETVLAEGLGTFDGAFLPLDQWWIRLSDPQRKFVTAPTAKAQRLIGAAGTGKTATLVIRSLIHLAKAEREKRPLKALFVTHSEASRKAIIGMLEIMDTQPFYLRDPKLEAVSLAVVTLASLCAETLKQNISEAEFVDRDAQDSKILQAMYIEQALESAKQIDLRSHLPHLSDRFRGFLANNETRDLIELFQHEIAIQIKGRAGDSFEVYRECPSLKNGLPVENHADKGYVYTVFRHYQGQLEASAQFDTDDVVISAVGQLDTPIWRRRRVREGYDLICIDEAHLFNINELQVFHFFTREPGASPISFAIDRAQAVGDRGWADDGIGFLGDLQGEETKYRTVFRSAPNIVDFSSAILSSGANLFANFSNSLIDSSSGLTAREEAFSQEIVYYEVSDDTQMLDVAFERADVLAKLTKASPWEVLITTLSDQIAMSLIGVAKSKNKAVSIIERRGDFGLIQVAAKSGHMVLGHCDYVGGLEFKAVVIVGVDKGRVPYESASADAESKNFARYTAHNRLYVAASRARLALELVGVSGRGPSDLLEAPMKLGIVRLQKW